MPASTGCSLTGTGVRTESPSLLPDGDKTWYDRLTHFADFTAYELPTKKWMGMISPKVRLHVRGKKRHFVSSSVKVDNRRLVAETDVSCACWPWHTDERLPRPSFTDDEVFEIVIERRFLLGYKHIRRTKSVTIDQVRTGDREPCTLSLYDGQYSPEELEGKITIGEITFMLSRG